MRYKLLIIVVATLFTVGCVPVGYETKYNTKIASSESYFLNLEKEQKQEYNNDLSSDLKIVKLEKKPKQKKGVEDMSFNKGISDINRINNRYKRGVKHNYKIVAQDMKATEFLYYIFQEVLKSDFSIDPKIKTIKEKITLKLDKRITKEELIELLKDLLRAYKIRMIEKDGVFRAIYTTSFPIETTGGSLITSQKIRDDISNDEVVAQYIECDYINAKDFISLASGIFFKSLNIKQLRDQNGFIVNGTYEQIKKVLNFKKVVDRPYMTKKHTSLVYFDYIVPSEFEKEFKKILSYQNVGDIKTLAFDSINALLVITSNKNNLQFLMKWKKKFDSYKKSNDAKETYFYYSKYRSINEIYDLVSQFNNTNIAVKAKKSDNENSLSDRNKKEFVKTEAKDEKILESKTLNDATPDNQGGDNSIKIIPDEARNVLIIQATPSQYKKLLDILNQVDSQPLQLLVEANIIELTLQNDLQYGMEWFLKNRTVDASPTSGAVNIFGKTTLGVGNSGFFGIVSSGYFNTVLNLFAKENLINVLSHPKILVLNGEEASIQVGEQIPTLTSTMSNVANPENAVSTVTYSNTGLTLNVKPSVTASGVVIMEISQSISKGQKNALSSISSPIILNRQINTKIVLKDNQSVIMGGLIQQDVSNTNSKVPIFGDIPIVKNLFRSTSKNVTKTELILLIKIHIVDNFDLLDQIKEKFSQMISVDPSCNAGECFESENISYQPVNISHELNAQEIETLQEQPYELEIIETLPIEDDTFILESIDNEPKKRKVSRLKLVKKQQNIIETFEPDSVEQQIQDLNDRGYILAD